MADLSTLDDRVLWNRATQARCEDAFRTLMTRHEDLVWNVCTRLLRHTSDAEDAFQMAFVAMLEHGNDIKSPDFRPWLYRVAYRAALRVQAGRLSADALTDANSIPEDSVDIEAFRSIERAEQSQLIDEALDSLPEKYREVLVLHYCCDVARDDIASQLGLTPQTVKARLSRARKALRSRLLRRGLSLSVAAVLLGSKSEAAIPQTLHDSTWQLAQNWLAGKPVGLDLAQFSDFPQTEYGMKSLSGLNAKWTLVGAAALLALFVVFEAGRAAGVSAAPAGTTDGFNAFPTNATQVAFDEDEKADIVPAAHFVSKPTTPDPVPQIASQNTPAVQQPAARLQTTQQPSRMAYQQPVPNTQFASATRSQQPARGLPNGTWKRDNMLSTVSFLVNENQLQVDFQGKGELAVVRASLLGEYSVASDGTVFGLFHGVDLDTSAGLGVDALGELGPLFSMVSDMPFAMRVHTTEGAMVVKSFTLGVGLPMMDGMEEYAQIGTMASMYTTGTYRSTQLPQVIGQLPPRVSAQAPLPRRMQPRFYREANPLPATMTLQPYPAQQQFYHPAAQQPATQLQPNVMPQPSAPATSPQPGAVQTPPAKTGPAA